MESKIRKAIREQIKNLHEGMSPEEWADAKEAERLKNHPEKDKINKIKQMMDKEKGITGMEDSDDDKQDWTPEDHEEEEKWQRGWKYESLKELAAKLGYLKEESSKLDPDNRPEFNQNEDNTYRFLNDLRDDNNLDNPEEIIMLLRKMFLMKEKEARRVYAQYLEDLKAEQPDAYDFYTKNLKEVDGMEEVDEQGLDQIERGINQITDGGRQSARVSDEGDKIKIKFSYARGEFDPEEWAKIINYLEGMGFFILDDSNYYESSYDYEDPPEQVPTIYIKKVDTSAVGLVPGDPDWPGEDDRDNFPNPEDLK